MTYSVEFHFKSVGRRFESGSTLAIIVALLVELLVILLVVNVVNGS